MEVMIKLPRHQIVYNKLSDEAKLNLAHLEDHLKQETAEEYPVLSHVFEEAYGISGIVFRSMINYLRGTKRPICANRKGYWWEKNDKVYREYLKSLESRVSCIMYAVRGGHAGIKERGNEKI
ncbi:MAG: hypothetical protein HOG49_43300 [Candidatus Scalindua sp.]|jgi:hypothetical protein|nr:hypothetical protein [Candidatus Scalindua sp.]